MKSPRVWWLALLCAVIPTGLGRCVPWRDLPIVYQGTDPLLQTALLEYVRNRPIWETGTWHAPFFAPAEWSLAFMDPMVGQSLLVFWLPDVGLPALVYNLCMALTLALAFGSTVLLARQLGLRDWAAGAAGVAYAVGPYAMGHLQHLNQLPSPWLPLSVWALTLIRLGRGWGVILWVLAMVLQLLSGVYGFAATAMVSMCVVPFLIPSWSPRARVGFLLGAVVVGVAIWAWSKPFQAAAAAHEGFERGPQHVGPFAARVADLWHAPSPHLLPWPAWVFGRPALYPGLLLGLVALVGLRSFLRDPGSRWVGWGLLVSAGLGFVLALGRSHPFPGMDQELTMPLAHLQDHVWPTRALRAPARLFLPATLLLAIIAAKELDRRWQTVTTARAKATLAALFVLLVLDLAPGPVQSLRVGPDPEEREILSRIEALPEGQTWTTWPQPCQERDEGPLEGRAMLWAAMTGRSLVGGTSGFVPQPTADLRRSCCGNPRACQRALRDRKVALIVMSTELVNPMATMEVWRGERWKIVQPLRTPRASRES